MEANMINPDEINSIVCLHKKRKLQDDLLLMPTSKHHCWGQGLVCDFPVSTIEPKMVGSSSFARGVESGPDSVSFSYNFSEDADTSMSSLGDAKTYLSSPKAHAFSKSAASPASSDDKSTQIDLYSLESRSMKKESSSKFGSPSISEDLHCLYREYGLHLSDNYDVRLLEIGSDAADCSFAEYQNEVIEECVDEDVDSRLYSNETAVSNYVLSSGRWTVDQDSQEGTKKPTIDKEFEQYFSALML